MKAFLITFAVAQLRKFDHFAAKPGFPRREHVTSATIPLPSWEKRRELDAVQVGQIPTNSTAPDPNLRQHPEDIKVDFAKKKNVRDVFSGDQKKRDIFCYLKKIFYADSNIDKFHLSEKTCSLVSTSGALLKTRNGEDIDKHDVVMRFHSSPTRGYEDHVGSRSDISMNGDHSGITAISASTTGHISIQSKIQRLFSEVYPNRKHMHSVPAGGLHDPTTGTKGVFFGLANCKRLDAYEMSPSMHAKTSPYHYYDVPDKKSNINADDNDWHGMIHAEHDLWRRISIAPESETDMLGKTSYPGFGTVDCPDHPESPGTLDDAFRQLHQRFGFHRFAQRKPPKIATLKKKLVRVDQIRRENNVRKAEGNDKKKTKDAKPLELHEDKMHA
jgi:hypothetical protein